MSIIHVILDSKEQSISKLRSQQPISNLRSLLNGKEIDNLRVKHIMHHQFPEAFNELVTQVGPDDQIFISMDFIDSNELPSVPDQTANVMKYDAKKQKGLKLISYSCFEHLKKWCNKYDFGFEDNPLKSRKLKPSTFKNIDIYIDSMADKQKEIRKKSEQNSEQKPKKKSIPKLSEDEQKQLERIWVQYRLMVAIISRSERFEKVASDSLTKQPTDDELIRAFRFYRLREPDMVGGSYFGEQETQDENAIDQLRSRIQKIAATDFNVLIKGDSGTGKETVAWAIHELSSRREMPFLAMNCAGFPDELLESELFGYKKGSHNLAVQDHEGVLEAINGGTLFLDELPEMSPRVQAKLLRLFESGAYRPVGSNEGDQYVDVRIIGAGQNKLINDPEKLRSDVKARIAQLTLELNPLKKLGKDIILKICSALLERYSFTSISRKGKDSILSPKDIREYQDTLRNCKRKGDLLANNDWKESNIRELNNFLRHWLAFGDEEFDQLEQNLEAEDVKIAVSESETIPIENYGEFAPYLGSFNGKDEIKAIFEKTPLENALKAYVNNLYNRYKHMGIGNEEPRKRKTKKEFAELIGSNESKLRNLLKKNSEQ